MKDADKTKVEPIDELGLLRQRVTELEAQETERKQAEEALRLHAEITANMAEGVYLVGLNDVVIRYANRKFEEIFGYKPGEMAGKHASIVNAPTDTSPEERAKEIMEVIYRTGEWHGEVKNIKKDGTPFWCYANVSVFTHPEYGEVLVAVHSDITERKKAQDAVSISEARFRELFNNMSSGVAVYEVRENGNDFVFTDFNRAGERIDGVKKEDVIGKTVLEAFPGVKDFGLFDVFQRVWRTGKPEHFPVSVYQDQRITGWRDNYVYKLPSGEIVAIYDDVTERKRAQEQLHRANRALEALSECNQAVIRATREWDLLHEICRIIVEVGGYRLAWVGYAEQDQEKTVRPVAQAGYDEGYLETVKVTWADTGRGRGPTGTAILTGKSSLMRSILTDPSYRPWRAEATKRGYASSIALPLIASGQTFGVLNIYSAEADAFDADEVKLLTELADDLAYGVIALRNSADRKEVEKQLESSLKEKEALLSEVHHRVKNNLQIISSLLDMSSMRVHDQQAIHFFTDACAKIHTMALVHSQLYRSGGLGHIDMASHVQELVAHLLAIHRGATTITSVVEIRSVYLPLLQAIPCALALNELISNAVNHAFREGHKGTIEISMYMTAEDTVLARVKDDGAGIPDEVDIYETDSMGLKLVRNLVQQQLNGTIQVELDNGTEFIIEFKVMEEEAKHA